MLSDWTVHTDSSEDFYYGRVEEPWKSINVIVPSGANSLTVGLDNVGNEYKRICFINNQVGTVSGKFRVTCDIKYPTLDGLPTPSGTYVAPPDPTSDNVSTGFAVLWNSIDLNSDRGFVYGVSGQSDGIREITLRRGPSETGEVLATGSGITEGNWLRLMLDVDVDRVGNQLLTGYLSDPSTVTPVQQFDTVIIPRHQSVYSGKVAMLVEARQSTFEVHIDSFTVQTPDHY
jgi:hypothetical protein